LEAGINRKLIRHSPGVPFREGHRLVNAGKLALDILKGRCLP